MIAGSTMDSKAERKPELGRRSADAGEVPVFYMLGLTFTILGLAIQTSSMGRNPVADSLEVLGWVLLFVPGLLGMLRLEGVPHSLAAFGEIDVQQTKVRQVKQMAHQGVRLTDADTLQPSDIPTLMAPGLFIAGMGSLLLARACVPVMDIVLTIRALRG